MISTNRKAVSDFSLFIHEKELFVQRKTERLIFANQKRKGWIDKSNDGDSNNNDEHSSMSER